MYLNAPSRRKFKRVLSTAVGGIRKYGAAAGVAGAAYIKKRLYPGAPPKRIPVKGRPKGPFKPKLTKYSAIKGGRGRFTADPTNSVSTSASGGMTTHSMTVVLGSKKNMTQKLVKSSKESWTLRFGAIQPYNNVAATSINFGSMVGGGAYALTNYNDLATAATLGAFNHTMPLHIYDLTSANNINLATPVYGTPCRHLYFTGTSVAAGIYPTTTVEFATMNGRTSDGVSTSPNWQMEKTTHPLSASYPLGTIMQEWTQIKMLCYGAKTFSTRFKVQVVQIVEDDFHPLAIATFTAVIPVPPVAWDDVSAPINFWQGVSSSSYKHPISTVSTDYRKNIKIIKEYNFIVDPTTTIEERAEVGHSKALNIFVPMYRQNNYSPKAQAIDGSLADSDNYGVDIDKNEAYLKPKARIYLIVQATNPYTCFGSGSIASPANTPSYDIVIRNKFSQLS